MKALFAILLSVTAAYAQTNAPAKPPKPTNAVAVSTNKPAKPVKGIPLDQYLDLQIAAVEKREKELRALLSDIRERDRLLRITTDLREHPFTKELAILEERRRAMRAQRLQYDINRKKVSPASNLRRPAS